MEELIRKYNEECDLIPKSCSRIWKVGLVILSITFLIMYIVFRRLILSGIICMLLILVLYVICEWKSLTIVNKRLSKYNNKKIDVWQTYKELNLFQKKWIMDYCKRNKINKIEKIQIIREYLSSKLVEKEKQKQYLNFGTLLALLVGIWESIIQKIEADFDLIPTIIVSLILAYIFSIITQFIKREYEENKKFFNIFESINGLKRLDELLVYAAIKCNK